MQKDLNCYSAWGGVRGSVNDTILSFLGFNKFYYYMACSCSRYNARSDWLIV